MVLDVIDLMTGVEVCLLENGEISVMNRCKVLKINLLRISCFLVSKFVTNVIFKFLGFVYLILFYF